MSSRLALDPGRQGFGWARGAYGQLVAAGVVPQPHTGASLELVAANVINALLRADTVVIERMRMYPPKDGKRRETEQYRTAVANDLLDLQAIGGMVAGALTMPERVRWVHPGAWKGSTTAEQIEARLDAWAGWLPAERPVWAQVKALGKTLRHNAVEAVALLLGEHGLARIRWV